MKKVLLSVHPKWCELIFNGKKTIEVRRTRPKLEPPFTVYVYCTKAKNIREDGLYLLPNDKELYLGCKEKDLGFVCWEGDFRNGKVIGSFICDKVVVFEKSEHGVRCKDFFALAESKLSVKEIRDYIGNKKIAYGLHISDLKIYDEPKELSEFIKVCPMKSHYCLGCEFYSDFSGSCVNRLTRPPQSWQYVEAI